MNPYKNEFEFYKKRLSREIIIKEFKVWNIKNIFYKLVDDAFIMQPKFKKKEWLYCLSEKFFNSLFKLIIFNIKIIRARTEPLQPIKIKKKKHNFFK